MRRDPAHRYGDCKDQSALLIAMLRAAGIPAEMALIESGSEQDVHPDHPGLGCFNHAIVHVPGSPELWIDPTTRFVPLGELPLSDQGRMAMVVSPHTKKLVRTPRGDYRNNRVSIHTELTLADPGEFALRQVLTFGGCMADRWRTSYADQSRESLRKALEDEVKHRYSVRTVTRFEYTHPTELSRPFQIECEAKDGTVGGIGEADVWIHVQPSELFDSLPYWFTSTPTSERGRSEDELLLPERKAPLQLHEPHVCESQYRIVPPPGFVAKSLPANREMQFGPATITQHLEKQENDVVLATFRLDAGPGRFAAEEANALRRGIAEMSPKDDPKRATTTIRFEHLGAQHMNAGHFKEGFAEYCRLLKQHPSQSGPRWRFALALVKAGLVEPARREARRAVELTPKSASAHLALGRVLLMDSWGREMGRGIDYAGAQKALQTALELYPGDSASRWILAFLLEHDQYGSKFSPESQLDEAIAQHRKGGQLPPMADLVLRELSVCLMHGAQWDELAKLAGKNASAEYWQSMQLLTIAVQKAPSAAVLWLKEQASTPEQRRAVLLASSSRLQTLRQYSKAKELLEAASSLDSDGELSAEARRLSQMRRFEDAEFPKTDPRWPVQHLFRALLSGGKFRQEIANLFVRGTKNAAVNAATRTVRLEVKTHLGSFATLATPPFFTGDDATLLEMAADGDQSIGQRIRVTKPSWARSTWFVAWEDGGYRLLPVLSSRAAIGEQAMRRLDAGDPEGTRRLLQWVWDEQGKDVGWFDPFAGTPFAQAWASAQRDDLRVVRMAAAALAGHDNPSEQAVAILEQCHADSFFEKHRLQIDRGLLKGYLALNRNDEGLRIIHCLCHRYGDAAELVLAQARALRQAGRGEELRALAAAQLEKGRRSADTMELMARYAGWGGDIATCQKHLLRLAEQGKISQAGVATLASNMVFLGSIPEKKLEQALVASGRLTDPGRLVPFAPAIVALELGQPAEAIRLAHAALEPSADPPEGDDWYFLGRLAEHCGLREIAVNYYRKLSKPKLMEANGPFARAQLRLKEARPVAALNCAARERRDIFSTLDSQRGFTRPPPLTRPRSCEGIPSSAG